MKKTFALGILTVLGVTGLVMSQPKLLEGRELQNSPFAQDSNFPNSQNQAYYTGLYGNVQNLQTNEADKLARQLGKAKTEGERESITAKLREASGESNSTKDRRNTRQTARRSRPKSRSSKT